MTNPTPIRPTPEKAEWERELEGEDGAHAIECDCDFNPDCEDPTHQSPEYHIGEECGKVQDTIRAAVLRALDEKEAATWRQAHLLCMDGLFDSKGLSVFEAAAAEVRAKGES